MDICSSAPSRLGRLFRLDANGKPFVLLDSPYNEIHTLKLDPKGVIYAAAFSGPGGVDALRHRRRGTPTPRRRDRDRSVSTEITAIAVVEPPAAGWRRDLCPHPDRANSGPSAGGVYRISPDGAWDLIWSSREDSPYDVAVEPDGSVLIGTGNKGKIYRLSGDPLQPTLVTRATAQQVTALLRDSDGKVTFATSNPGKLLRLSQTRADRGTYTSDVRDAQTIATWGAIRVAGGGTAGHTHRDLDAIGQHAHAGRDVERLDAGLRGPGRKSDLQPSGALPAVARGADRQSRRCAAAHIGDRRLSAAQHPAGGDVDHDQSAGHGLSASLPDR